jgi:ribose 5-phosphate isomerase B
MTKIFIGSDHAGFQLKEAIIQELILEHEITDCGTTSTESTDYPVYASNVAERVLENSPSIGVLICSTGIGMSIAANRHRGIRAALCHSVKESKLARHHNNANVLVLGASNTAVDVALDMIKSFLATPFDGGRHERRIHQIDA